MAKIHYLEENLKNMIAAGEVVERPSGIIKELIDNSIDANAKRIEIRIKSGGLSEIEVIDDGDGMDFQDSIMCFKRHATSKISKETDLFKIMSLGFRGEALPSIASVAKVYLTSNDGSEGSEVLIHYGQLMKHEVVACNKGTYLKISGLFYQTPARLKYLKSEQYEQAIIVDVVNKFALAHPEISFQLQNENNCLVSTRGDNKLRNTIFSIYGREIAKSSFEIKASDLDYELEGIGILPNYSRANKYYINLYINSRMIKQYQLTKIIADAYHKYMPDNRYPIISLNIKMDPQLVDVNVHPAKWEVRISKQKQLEKLIYESIIAALEKEMEIPTLQDKDIYKQREKSDVKSYQLQMTKPIYQEDTFEKIEFDNSPIKEINNGSYEVDTSEVEDKYLDNEEILIDQVDKENNPIITDDNEDRKTINRNQEIANLKIIGNLHASYIICENEAGLILVDQHAAMERYNYEKFQRTMFVNTAEIPLLIPLEFNLNLNGRKIDKINTELQTVGIKYEIFGDRVIVRSIPTWLNTIKEVKIFLQDILELFESNPNYILNELTKDKIASKACKASIKFNQHLTMEEQREILYKLSTCVNPYNCPHGRPTLIRFSNSDLERLFKRWKKY